MTEPRALPPFTGDNAVCIKCGSTGGHYTEWVPKGMYTARGTFGECLDRRCRRCGYTWPEAIVEP